MDMTSILNAVRQREEDTKKRVTEKPSLPLELKAIPSSEERRKKDLELPIPIARNVAAAAPCGSAARRSVSLTALSRDDETDGSPRDPMGRARKRALLRSSSIGALQMPQPLSPPLSPKDKEPKSVPKLPGLPRARVRVQSRPHIFSDFTPYSEKYGCHPKAFFLDADGVMVKDPQADMSPGSRCSVLEADEGDVLECTVQSGVMYRAQPRLAASFPDFRRVDEGQKIKVVEREGNWVRDEVGWLPIILCNTPVFSLRIEVGLPRCGVITASGRAAKLPSLATTAPAVVAVQA
eukprot:TRINITY_DN28534_c0_g1_i1.p1 TRINITY_DN28534_c0_g1~~TRINITY_DN28534_c0_g1_i1.p1  ORF type:complete len:314 (-),score=68.02 TRINITY_DN28534_c0_g1_i1:287-1165(-)